jgi:hypothetical protein
MTVGGMEMLGYVMVVASTVRLELYRYESWWRWKQAVAKVKSLLEIRLTRLDLLVLLIGVLLIVIGGYRETCMALNL